MSEIVKRPSNSKVQVPAQPTTGGSVAIRSARFPGGKPDAGITPRTVLNALRLWWKWTVPAALLLTAGAGAVVFWLFEPKYEATALIQIRIAAPYLAFAPDMADSRAGRRFVETQIELLRDPLVLGSVVSQSDIRQLPELTKYHDSIRALAEQIRVRAVGKSELYRIMLSSTDPEAAAETVNAVMESYFNLLEKDEANIRQSTIELLEEENERRLRNIVQLRKQLRKSAQSAGLGGSIFLAAEGNRFIRHPIANLRERLTVAEVNKEILTVRIQVAEKLVDQPVNIVDLVVEERLDADAEVQRLENQLANYRLQHYEVGRRLARPSHNTRYRQLDEDITRTEQILNEYRQKLCGQVRAEIEQRQRNEREGEVAKLRNELQSCTVMVELFTKEYESQFRAVQEESGESIDLQFRMAELTRSEDVMERISNRAIALQTERRAPARVFKRRDARVPLEPLEALPMKQLAAAMGGAFILPFLLAVFWERLARRISAPEHLKKNSYLDVVGEISRLPARRIGTSGRRVDVTMQLFEESIDALRTNLILSPDAGDLRVLAVTSAANNEGKTSVATQLARSIGRTNKRPTLLVDGDLRSPDLHHVFQIPLEPGLAQVLSGECDFKDAVFEQADQYVHVTPAGTSSENIHSLFASGKIRQFFEEATKNYDFVIVDTPPVLAAAESLVIGAAADGMLICAMRDVSRGDQMEKACERLSRAGVRSIGTVLNGVPCRQYTYYNGQYSQQVHREGVK